MTRKLSRVDDVSEYCPACLTCLTGDPETCPECGQARYKRGWKPLELCSHAYLGYLLDERYLLDKFLGGGASGEVYRATDRKLRRPFALKIVELGRYHRSDEREEHVRRFKNEVQALSRLRNPHVINIYESFRLEEETSALLTEYIDGVTLDGMLQEEGAIGFDRSMLIVRQIANGLHEAHQQGVVHRDIKPGNIMVEQLPAAGFFARILDFGLVHMIEDVSQTRGFRGTPLYAAPEQCSAEMPVDSRCDIYALGCVLFHCLVGRPPFWGDDAVKIIEEHLNAEPPALADIDPDLVVPDSLERLLAKMLRKDPDDRPDNLRSVIAVLDDIVEENQSYGARVAEEVEGESDREVARSVDGADDISELSSRKTDVGLGAPWTSSSSGLPAELLKSVDLREFLDGYTQGASAVRLAAHGRCILLCDGQNKVHLVSRGAREFVGVFSGARMRLTGVAAHLTGGHIYASEMNGTVRRWAIDRMSQKPTTAVDFPERVLAIDVDQAGRKLFAGTERGKIVSHDLRTGEHRQHCALSSPVCQLRTNRDGSRVLAATMSGKVELVTAGPSTTERSQVDEFDEEPAGVAVDARLQWAGVIERQGRLNVVNLHDRSTSFTVSPVPTNLRSVAFANNGQMLGLTLQDSVMRLWVFHHEPVGRQDFQG